VARQTGVASLRWLGSEDSNKVIEGLKAMCARAGFDADPALSAPELKARLVRRQRLILAGLGVETSDVIVPENLDQAIERHGVSLRRAKAGTGDGE